LVSIAAQHKPERRRALQGNDRRGSVPAYRAATPPRDARWQEKDADACTVTTRAYSDAMQDAKAKTFTGNSGKAKGREFLLRTGERHYINHSPYFSVHYYPHETPEKVWYKTWEDDM